MKSLVVEVPTVVYLPRKTKKDKPFRINLNHTRNAHYHEQNQAKGIFHEIVKDYLEKTKQTDVVFEGQVYVEMKVFKASNRRLDKQNVTSIATKYLYDSLVSLGILPDDNDNIIQDEHIFPTEVDRENPRVVFTFYEYNKKE